MLLASLQGTIGPSWRSPTHWNSFPQPLLGGTSPSIPDVRVNPAFPEIANWIAFHDTVYCGVTASHRYFGWMLRQFWFWFPDNCFLMDLGFFFFFLVPNRCLHQSLVAIFSFPQSLTCSLMNLPHTELGPRQTKRPFHQNIRDGKACSHPELVFHLGPTWPGGPASRGMGEHLNPGYC